MDPESASTVLRNSAEENEPKGTAISIAKSLCSCVFHTGEECSLGRNGNVWWDQQVKSLPCMIGSCTGLCGCKTFPYQKVHEKDRDGLCWWNQAQQFTTQLPAVNNTSLLLRSLSNVCPSTSPCLEMSNDFFCHLNRAKLVTRIHEEEMKSQNYQVSRGWQPFCACEFPRWAGPEPGSVHGALVPHRLLSPSSRPGSWWVRTSILWWSSR